MYVRETLPREEGDRMPQTKSVEEQTVVPPMQEARQIDDCDRSTDDTESADVP